MDKSEDAVTAIVEWVPTDEMRDIVDRHAHDTDALLHALQEAGLLREREQ